MDDASYDSLAIRVAYDNFTEVLASGPGGATDRLRRVLNCYDNAEFVLNGSWWLQSNDELRKMATMHLFASASESSFTEAVDALAHRLLENATPWNGADRAVAAQVATAMDGAGPDGWSLAEAGRMERAVATLNNAQMAVAVAVDARRK
jgi:hypothetical protein